MRVEFQVLVIPFIIDKQNNLKVAVFKRIDGNYWQFIAGGGERNETILESAQREAYEEAKIESNNKFYKLDTVAMVPKTYFHEHKNRKGIYVIPEYCFGVLLKNEKLILSSEHSEYFWLNYEKAINCLKYDSNKTALWELKERIDDGSISIT